MKIQTFLLEFPNLHTFSSESSLRYTLLVPSLLSSELALKNTLQDLSLHESLPTAMNIFDIMSFPSLYRLKVEHIQVFEIPNGMLPLNRSNTTREHQHLELGW